MPTVGIRELKTRATQILRRVREEEAKYVITYRGEPVGILLPVDEAALEDFLLASHPFFAEMRAKARREIAAGKFVGKKELLRLR